MCALIRKHVACALIMAEGRGDSGEIVPAPESTSFVDTTSGSEREDESTSILDSSYPKRATRSELPEATESETIAYTDGTALTKLILHHASVLSV